MNEFTDKIRVDLKSQLDALEDTLSRTHVLCTILDDEWSRVVRDSINHAQKISSVKVIELLQNFSHVLRGSSWFEEDQSQVLSGNTENFSKEQKVIVGLFGLDPLKTVIPELDRRFCALTSLPFKKNKIKDKFNQLRSNRFKKNFNNHMFEVSVLGFFALKGVLEDIEPEDTNVDGVINIDNRKILIEATYTSQEVLSKTPGIRFEAFEPLIDQVIYKIQKKVENGRQLDLVDNSPTLLAIGLNRYGANDIIARMGLEEYFKDGKVVNLSGVVLSNSWEFMKNSFGQGNTPSVPFTRKELKILSNWFEH